MLQEAEDEKQRAIADANRYFADAKANALLHRQQIIDAAQKEVPVLFEEFLDTLTKSGVTPRATFERFVNKRMAEFESQLGVSGQVVLEPGDREQFIADGGVHLSDEVEQLKRDREYGG